MAWGRRSGMGRRRIARRLSVRRASGRAAAILLAIGGRAVGGDRRWGRSFAAAAAPLLSWQVNQEGYPLESSFIAKAEEALGLGGGSMGGGVGWWRRAGPRQR